MSKAWTTSPQGKEETLKGAVFIDGKVVKIIRNQDGSETWRIYTGADMYMVTVSKNLLNYKPVSVENKLRIFARPGRKPRTYTAQDYEIRG